MPRLASIVALLALASLAHAAVDADLITYLPGLSWCPYHLVAPFLVFEGTIVRIARCADLHHTRLPPFSPSSRLWHARHAAVLGLPECRRRERSQSALLVCDGRECDRVHARHAVYVSSICAPSAAFSSFSTHQHLSYSRFYQFRAERRSGLLVARRFPVRDGPVPVHRPGVAGHSHADLESYALALESFCSSVALIHAQLTFNFSTGVILVRRSLIIFC